MPAFNHARSDGPFDPCPLCLEELTRDQLIALSKDQRHRIEHALARVAELHDRVAMLERSIHALYSTSNA